MHVQNQTAALDFEHARPDVLKAITSVQNRTELEGMLQRVIRLHADFRTPDIYGRKLFVSWLDKLIPPIARRLGLVDVAVPTKSNERIVVLATCIYSTGGHSQIVKDVMHAFPDQVTGIYTNIYGELPEDQAEVKILQTEYRERAWLIPRRRLLIDRAIDVYMMLRAIQPTRVLVMSHPMDVVSILAAWPFRRVAEFIHHVDHVPALGATLPFSSHVDVTYTCHLACSDAGLRPIYAGMAAPSTSGAPRQSDSDGLVIATCGSPHKFRGAGEFTWGDYAVAALTAKPDARIHHIGPGNEEFERSIWAALDAAGVDRTRYRITGTVRSLHAELQASGADIYVSSYPENGGKANLEALAAHLPLILPQDASVAPLLRFGLPLERWVEVDTPAGMAAAIDKALSMREGLRSDAGRADVARELARFRRFLDGELTTTELADDTLQS